MKSLMKIIFAQKIKTFNLVKAYSTVLYDFVKKNKKTIVLDADLTKDTGNFEVMLKLPKQFVEFGIADKTWFHLAQVLLLKNYFQYFTVFLVFYRHVLKNKFSILFRK